MICNSTKNYMTNNKKLKDSNKLSFYFKIYFDYFK